MVVEGFQLFPDHKRSRRSDDILEFRDPTNDILEERVCHRGITSVFSLNSIGGFGIPSEIVEAVTFVSCSECDGLIYRFGVGGRVP